VTSVPSAKTTTSTRAAAGRTNHRTGSKLQYQRQKSIEGLAQAFENANAAADSSEAEPLNTISASLGTSRTSTTISMWFRSLFESELTRVRKNFVKEMRILNGLRHPCVAQIVGAVLHPEPLMIMVRSVQCT